MSERRIMQYNNIAFIGFGLIAGSIAKAIRKYRPESIIYAYTNNRSELLKGKSDGIIDIILEGIDSTLSDCDIVFLCTPVELNDKYIKDIKLRKGGRTDMNNYNFKISYIKKLQNTMKLCS